MLKFHCDNLFVLGYDTMSSSASPGSSNSRVPDHTSVLPKPDTIDDIVDPVALIDARIKVKGSSNFHSCCITTYTALHVQQGSKLD